MAVRVAAVLLISAVCGTFPCAALAQPADPLEGRTVREIHITGLRKVSTDSIERQLATRVGEPFRRANLTLDRRRLDELRLFTTVVLEPRLDGDAVVLDVALTETLRLLPVVVLRVTDENGVSIGPGVRGINLFGGGTQSSVSSRFGGETGIAATIDATTIAPGTWLRHVGFSYTDRQNTLYDFDERATSIDARFGRNWTRGIRTGVAAEFLQIDTGTSGASLSPDGTDANVTIGGFATLDTLDSSTNPRHGSWAEVEVDRLFGDSDSWTLILDGRRYQRLAERHGLTIFALATFQSGEVGTGLPEYLQFSLGGANTIRGWSLDSQRGRNQFIGTFEYIYVAQPVRPFTVAKFNFYAGLQVAGFADLGRAWNHQSDLDATAALDGYGIGLRLLVPFVDLIRLDLAWGEPGRGATAYFGVSLKAVRQRQRVR